MMRVALAIMTMGLALGAASASAQQTAPAPTPQNPGGGGGPLGQFRGASNDPGDGGGDMPGKIVGQKHVEGMPKGPYGPDLMRRIADAQKLVDEVKKGRALGDGDTGRIRNLMREDFIAWRKAYEMMSPTAYRTERDRWMVEPAKLSPNAWAQQRLDWLLAQRDWILSNGG